MEMRSDIRLAGEKRVSIVVPVYNEQASIRPFVIALDAALVSSPGTIAFDILFVNDGSTDRTEQEITALIAQRHDIALINLSRNFGKEAALSAGIQHADGQAVIPIDVDLQEPPDLIPAMIDLWEQGAKVVNARRGLRDTDHWFKRASAGAFYRIFNLLAEQPIPDNVGDFRLLDREVVNAIRTMGERSRFNKAIFSWAGFETAEIVYERRGRETGQTAWSYWKLWKLALDGIFASSTTPLRIWTYIGVIMFLASLCYTAFILYHTLALGIDTPGYASTIITILTFGGLNMVALGIIGEYVGRIYKEVRQRPLFIIRSFVDHAAYHAEGAHHGS